MNIMKSWQSIKWNISWWMWHNSPIYINSLNFNKLFDEWRDVKTYLRKPSYKYWGHWYTKWTTIFRLEINELQWKTKYGEYRHEEDPEVELTIFGHCFRWTVSPEKNNNEDISLQYYETILLLQDYLKKYNRAEAVYKAIRENTWGECDDKDSQEINCINMLTEYGKHLYDIIASSKLAKKH